MQPSSYDELNELCRTIQTSFVHLETRDSYGTEVELPRMAKWRRGEPDDFEWLQWWLELLREHRRAGRICRRARIVSEPLSDYQQWTLSHARLFADAGEEIRYAPRPLLVEIPLPGSGDFYVFDNKTVLYLHYAGSGMNAHFERSDDPKLVEFCRESFEAVWTIAPPLSEYKPQ